MHALTELFRSSSSLRAIALALIAIGAAGCSADSTRFNGGQGEVTGSIPPGQAAPVGRVESRPLPQTSQLPPPPPPARADSGVVAGGGRGMASYSPSAAPYNPPPTPTYSAQAVYNPPPPRYNPAPAAAYNPPPSPTAYSPAGYSSASYSPASYNPAPYNPAPSSEVTGSAVAPTSVVRKPTSSGQWSWDGGTAVTVVQGETVETIAHRHGVPVGAVLEANNLASSTAIQPGQRLVIPRFIPSLTAPAPVPTTTHAAEPTAPKLASVSTIPAAAPTYTGAIGNQHAAASASSGVHVVAAGDTLTKIAHQYGKSVAEIVKANNIQPTGKLNIGDRIVIPGTRVSNAKPEVEQAAAPIKPATNKVALASAAPTQSASMVTPTETPVVEAAPKAVADATPGFRWPVRGRIIAGFGPKPNGQQNDGIDVAVPENTPIKAAEDGEVAYAGSELKGYGNLVLVKHPNGYVTAYAHAKELLVKRGDKIKRGDVIAKSGQSGNVDAPQLHFEVRKGSAPVDPMQFLNGA
jgi:murein DD-endopeptidase MepM/ murein hydrolase activator NlpD